jgi:hypothetical protein
MLRGESPSPSGRPDVPSYSCAVHAVLRETLDTVLSDLNGTTQVTPRVVDEEWTDFPGRASAMLYAADGSAQGIAVTIEDDPGARYAELADQVQEWAVEELARLGESPVWPECPEHPDSHPLAPVYDGGLAVWRCPRTGRTVSPIGALARVP